MQKIIFKTWTIPIALLLLVITGFGLLIGSLGFYQDDWYLVWMGLRSGPQIYLDFFEGSRPFLAGIYILTTELIGGWMLGWQIFALLTRWLVVLAAWWVLRLLWPKHTLEVTWIAVLLAIYPGFKQHFVAVVYSNAYIALAAFLFSLGAMLLAIRRPGWRWPLTILGVLAAVFSMVTTEYFFGLELFRPVFLWIVFSETYRRRRDRLRLTLIHWAPYLVATAAFLIWRVFFFKSYMYGPKMVENLAADPFMAAFTYFQTILQDALEASLFAWTQTFDFLKTIFPDLRSFIISWGVVILVSVATAFYLLHLESASSNKSNKKSQTRHSRDSEEDPFARQAIFIGLFSTLITGWPFWYAGLQVELTSGFDRVTLPYMFGAAILVVGLLAWLVKRDRHKIVIISILTGAAVLFQIRNTQTYQVAHQVQADFFQQLIWRAPGLKPDTKVLINDMPVDYTGNASMNAALNWVYHSAKGADQDEYKLYYLPFKLGSPELPDLESGPHTQGVLVADYQPPGCVQVIDPAVNQQLPRLSEAVEQASKLSDLRQIELEGQQAQENYQALFGAEEAHGWCYYFEKADKARQTGDWQEVVRLGEEASAADLKPYAKFSSELLPFIEGYVHLEQWNQAYRLSQSAIQDVPALRANLCETWARSLENSQSSTERESVVKRVNQLLDCSLEE